MPVLFLLQGNYGLSALIGVAALLTACGVIAAFFVTRTIYKTTLPTRQAETWKANYEGEKVRADKATSLATELTLKVAEFERERATVAIEYSQLAQLYAKKSIILETMTGEFTNLAEIAESGRLGDYLRAREHPIEDIHTTKDAPRRRPGER